MPGRQGQCGCPESHEGQHGAPQTVIAEASLGMSEQPSGKIVSAQAPSGLFTYKLLSAPYIGYLGARGTFPGYLLWPACFSSSLAGAPPGGQSPQCCQAKLAGAVVSTQIPSDPER
jgi:hypothetical protein